MEDILAYKKIISQLKKYNLLGIFETEKELEEWVSGLNELEKRNILSLEIDPSKIKFSTELLINRDLLNTVDYKKRVNAIASIENASGSYHLFDRLLVKEFLDSEKYYQDIETLKRAKSAQVPLWIISESTFINSPYHDEDFESLVTAEDKSGERLDFVVWEAIAMVASSYASISSKEHHRKDIETMIKYSSPSLQTPHSYPEASITYLATNEVSLKDPYHRENMELLAQNPEIGNFLYPLMTNLKVINRKDYRLLIRDMIEHKDNKKYAFLVCLYAVGEEEVKRALNVTQLTFLIDLENEYDIKELLKLVKKRIGVIDGSVSDGILEIEEKNTDEKKKRRKFFNFTFHK